MAKNWWYRHCVFLAHSPHVVHNTKTFDLFAIKFPIGSKPNGILFLKQRKIHYKWNYLVVLFAINAGSWVGVFDSSADFSFVPHALLIAPFYQIQANLDLFCLCVLRTLLFPFYFWFAPTVAPGKITKLFHTNTLSSWKNKREQ